ncbi:UNKNOWN [Stylonychia lemnae]|uniref:Uncharacterized protein n=1 Tax=Stylonychia lemnae TaxID=5949 RepID=A0A078A9Z1_STYLE|nr:UNKNOWN [Stylonychia lemnae]|eukprot:CDW79009.1 UNKNOWN [Stylonychia lemnae]
MGCKESKQDGLGNGPESGGGSGGKSSSLPSLQISGLDGPGKFEALLPFSKTKIEEFEIKIKMASGQEKDMTLEQLRKGFSDDKNWSDALNQANSPLLKSLEHELFKSEENPDQLNRDAIIIWALLLCGGDVKVKAKVFYDVLQDNNQEHISSSDKDFPPSLNTLVDLACKLPFIMSAQLTNEPSKKSEEDFQKIDGIKEAFLDKFLDEIYGAKSKLLRVDWETEVAKKTPWLFSTKKIRSEIDKIIKEQNS